MTDRELLHKWLGGMAGQFQDRLGRDLLIQILQTCERRRPYSWPTDPNDEISLCSGCHCMTKTIEAKCGKCQAPKSIQKVPKMAENYTKPSEPIQVNPKSHHYMEPSDG